MSTRRTTRSTKQPGPTIVDHFRERKAKGADLPGKSLGDEDSSTTSSAKRSLFSNHVHIVPSEVEQETIPVETKQPESKSKTARALFGVFTEKASKVKKETKEETTKEDVKEKVVEPVRSIIPTEADILEPKASVTRKLGAAHLQSELAKKAKGPAKLHKQVAERELVQMAERKAILKSPQKMIKTRIEGGSPPKRAKKEKESKKRGPVKVLPTPDFVLPSKSVEKSKERPVRETSEERETSPQDDFIRRAPLGYGSSLMTEEVKRLNHTKLPSSYKELHELFKSCDQVFSFSKTKGRTLTLSLLSEHLRISRKVLTLDRFLQLLAVYPQAYSVQAKKISCVGGTAGGVRSSRWEYVIKPNLDDDLTSFVNGPLLSEQPIPSEPILTTSPRKNLFSPMKGRPITSSAGIRIPASPRKPASPVKLIQREVVMDTTKQLEGWRLNCRQQVFHCLLSRRVIAAHETFMDGLNLDPSVLPPPSSTSLPPRFNEEFSLKIDSLCPSIEKAQIEQFPEEDIVGGNSYNGMSQFIKQASDTVTVIPKAVDEALVLLRSPEKKLVSSRGVPLSPAKFAQSPKKPMSVLERIKAKKAEEAAKAMLRNPELEKKYNDLRRLVSDKILTLIFNIYQGCTRTSMNTTQLTDKLVDSKRIDKDHIPSLLDRLTTIASANFSLEKTQFGQFLKVKPDNSPSTCTMVEDIVKKAMEECVRQLGVHSLRAP